MLTVAITGGIGSGKSTVARVLAEFGAVVVDSDRLAREVVQPGTPGLAAVAAEFGPAVLAPDGSLDRAALAAIVFADPAARHRLEQITHPLVRAAFDQERAVASPGAIVVNDIPLLRSLEVAAGFHLVVTTGADEETRVTRLIERGLTEADARARIRSQISDEQRRSLTDVWIQNDDGPDELREAVAALWSQRLVPFDANLVAGARAGRGPAVLVEADPDWVRVATLLGARISTAAGGLPVEHIGSTSVSGLAAKDIVDLQLVVPDLATADRLADPLAAAGFPRVDGLDQDNPHPAVGLATSAVAAGWAKRFHANADPGRAVNLHVRVRDAPNRRWALLFRDWLRASPVVREEYQTFKRTLADRYASDRDSAGYAEAKEPWFTAAAGQAEEWAGRTGWHLPSGPACARSPWRSGTVGRTDESSTVGRTDESSTVGRTDESSTVGGPA